MVSGSMASFLVVSTTCGWCLWAASQDEDLSRVAGDCQRWDSVPIAPTGKKMEDADDRIGNGKQPYVPNNHEILIVPSPITHHRPSASAQRHFPEKAISTAGRSDTGEHRKSS